MKQSQQRIILDISWEALLKVLAFVVGIWLVVLLREVLILLFAVFILVAAVNPTISRWQKHMSRFLAVLLFYAIFLGVVAVIVSVFVPSFIRQVNDLARALPEILDRLRPWLASFQTGSSSIVDQTFAGFERSFQGISQGIVERTFVLFGGLATVFTGLVLGFYLLLEESNAREFFHQVLPHHRFEAVYNTVSKISDRMGSWVRGQVLLMLIIGASNLIVYLAVGLPSPLPLAIWAGLCEAIPYIGPLIGVLPAVIVAITTGSVLQAVLVVILGFFLIQQLEAHVVVPKVMSKAVGLSPVLVILALTVGVKLFGLIGAILAIPVAAIISVVVGEWSSLRKIWESAE